ncbi:hypothetical protein PM082_014363 [Marasmius tenuissimus]|nr:hypothetical protein PM082_014363 [Marasmius tenuissimus]
MDSSGEQVVTANVNNWVSLPAMETGFKPVKTGVVDMRGDQSGPIRVVDKGRDGWAWLVEKGDSIARKRITHGCNQHCSSEEQSCRNENAIKRSKSNRVRDTRLQINQNDVGFGNIYVSTDFVVPDTLYPRQNSTLRDKPSEGGPEQR